MRQAILLVAAAIFAAAPLCAQDREIRPAENLVVDSIAKIPMVLAETAGRYGAYRSGGLADWHPERREMLISTRFGDTPQLHRKFPSENRGGC